MCRDGGAAGTLHHRVRCEPLCLDVRVSVGVRLRVGVRVKVRVGVGVRVRVRVRVGVRVRVRVCVRVRGCCPRTASPRASRAWTSPETHALPRSVWAQPIFFFVTDTQILGGQERGC